MIISKATDREYPESIHSSALHLYNTIQFRQAFKNKYEGIDPVDLFARARKIIQYQFYDLYKISLTRFCVMHPVAEKFISEDTFKYTPKSFIPDEDEISLYIKNPKFLWRFSMANYGFFQIHFTTKIPFYEIDNKYAFGINYTYDRDTSPLVAYVCSTNQIIDTSLKKKLKLFRPIYRDDGIKISKIDHYAEKFTFPRSGPNAMKELIFSDDVHLHLFNPFHLTYSEFLNGIITGKYTCAPTGLLRFQLEMENEEVKKLKEIKAKEKLNKTKEKQEILEAKKKIREQNQVKPCVKPTENDKDKDNEGLFGSLASKFNNLNSSIRSSIRILKKKTDSHTKPASSYYSSSSKYSTLNSSFHVLENSTSMSFEAVNPYVPSSFNNLDDFKKDQKYGMADENGNPIDNPHNSDTHREVSKKYIRLNNKRKFWTTLKIRKRSADVNVNIEIVNIHNMWQNASNNDKTSSEGSRGNNSNKVPNSTNSTKVVRSSLQDNTQFVENDNTNKSKKEVKFSEIAGNDDADPTVKFVNHIPTPENALIYLGKDGPYGDEIRFTHLRELVRIREQKYPIDRYQLKNKSFPQDRFASSYINSNDFCPQKFKRIHNLHSNTQTEKEIIQKSNFSNKKQVKFEHDPIKSKPQTDIQAPQLNSTSESPQITNQVKNENPVIIKTTYLNMESKPIIDKIAMNTPKVLKPPKPFFPPKVRTRGTIVIIPQDKEKLNKSKKEPIAKSRKLKNDSYSIVDHVAKNTPNALIPSKPIFPPNLPNQGKITIVPKMERQRLKSEVAANVTKSNKKKYLNPKSSNKHYASELKALNIPKQFIPRKQFFHYVPRTKFTDSTIVPYNLTSKSNPTGKKAVPSILPFESNKVHLISNISPPEDPTQVHYSTLHDLVDEELVLAASTEIYSSSSRAYKVRITIPNTPVVRVSESPFSGSTETHYPSLKEQIENISSIPVGKHTSPESKVSLPVTNHANSAKAILSSQKQEKSEVASVNLKFEELELRELQQKLEMQIKAKMNLMKSNNVFKPGLNGTCEDVSNKSFTLVNNENVKTNYNKNEAIGTVYGNHVYESNNKNNINRSEVGNHDENSNVGEDNKDNTNTKTFKVEYNTNEVTNYEHNATPTINQPATNINLTVKQQEVAAEQLFQGIEKYFGMEYNNFIHKFNNNTEFKKIVLKRNDAWNRHFNTKN